MRWPMGRPKTWIEFVNHSERESELGDLRLSVQRGCPFGREEWVIKIAQQFKENKGGVPFSSPSDHSCKRRAQFRSWAHPSTSKCGFPLRSWLSSIPA